MASDIIVPPLSQTMDSVVLVEWLKAEGDAVKKGEPLFVIETDKANLDIEAPAGGILRRVSAQPGEEVMVRSSIGIIAAADEVLPEDVTEAPAVEAAVEEATSAARPPVDTVGPKGEPLPERRLGRIFASPRARRLAEQEGIALAALAATGPQQMIVERDVRAYMEAPPAAPAITPVARRLAEAAGLEPQALQPARPGARITRADVEAALAEREVVPAEGVQWVDVSPVRRTIARRMVESQQAAAEVTLTRDVDATELVDLRGQILEELDEGDPRPTYTDLLVVIVARQLRLHPRANATWDGARIGQYADVNIAVAVDTERGLVTPVVRNADKKGLLELTEERASLVRQALDGTIGPDDLTGGTFTITNLGPLGIDAFTPIINPPQTAILGVGRIRPAPAVCKGELCIRQRMYLSLTFDHRIIDGAPAARFLADVARLIEKPHLIWL
jgi:pyruvate dehydrogenase E2 component (dihydrolipoamide acetyltransferase)